MKKPLLAIALCVGAVQPAAAASLTLGGLIDGEGGQSWDVDGRVEPVENWHVGAGAGHSELGLAGEDFSGNSLRLSTDLDLGPVSLGASGQRWKDSSQLESTVLQGRLGWNSPGGFSATLLFEDRGLEVTYTATVAGQTRERAIDFDGTGFGADLSYYGESWNAGLRVVDYSYGSSVDRVRTLLAQPATLRFPRLAVLIGSAVTRTAGAPDRVVSAMLGRQFRRSSLQGDFTVQRDALTGDDVQDLALTLGYEVSRHVSIDTTVGFSDGDATDTLAYGGLAVTLRR